VYMELKSSKIAAEFPGRSQKSLQVSYCVNFKKRAEKFQDDDVHCHLKAAVNDRKNFFRRFFAKRVLKCGNAWPIEWGRVSKGVSKRRKNGG
jgi:hypothetical protein